MRLKRKRRSTNGKEKGVGEKGSEKRGQPESLSEIDSSPALYSDAAAAMMGS
jgi:hypothetical protein